ncbi:hypothetical protein JOC36_000684 [Weissella uvarum]|uniref:sunset domain-containing protein n=1 Tax=Weissella uvarum TaxID=1479233 RepID=UPI00195FAD56|nr:Ada metal-binding domain-containing protein [Weissella uvarum]MBM7617135.1 hypothetical protein [Weissella uvarum]MCM0595431.1 hypothetical protein [Weissella uvarum]
MNSKKNAQLMLLTLLASIGFGTSIDLIQPTQIDAAKKVKTQKKAKKLKIVGNKRTKIYHMPYQRHYNISPKNRIYFSSQKQAKKMGYRMSKQ